MREDLKVQVYDRMTDPSFRHTKGHLAAREADEFEWSYCALGVVCDLAVQAGVKVDVVVEDAHYDDDEDDEDQVLISFDGCTTLPPSQILAWAEIEGHEAARIYTRNDWESSTAQGIADWIKNDYPRDSPCA